MKKIIPAVKGTRDFYPDLMSFRTWLYDNLRLASESFGYQEYEAPLLETIDLYAAKSGEELVKEQSYVFIDRSGEFITLRPELTPSLARMIAQKQNELIFPVRWWSFGPFWRYERPQKGRSREFFQWNIDLLGVNSPEADAELIAVAVTFFRLVGLQPEKTRILVNDRQLMENQFDRLGFSKTMRPVISSLVDRRAKMEPQKWDEAALEEGVDRKQLSGLKAVLDDKDLWRGSENLTRLFDAIRMLGVEDYVSFDANVVRGLLYYTSTVFEAFDTSGSVRRSILGGGRYDNLLSDVGGQPMPATGFAMGDVVVSLVLAENGLVPDFDPTSAKILVTVFSPELLDASLNLAAELRQAGMQVILYPEPARMNKQFKYADRMKLRWVLILGSEEVEDKRVSVKDLEQGIQEAVARDRIVEYLRKTLA